MLLRKGKLNFNYFKCQATPCSDILRTKLFWTPQNETQITEWFTDYSLYMLLERQFQSEMTPKSLILPTDPSFTLFIVNTNDIGFWFRVNAI